MQSFVARVTRAVMHPTATSIQQAHNIIPGAPLLHYTRRAKQQGLKQPWFILSFDCDTERDIEIVTTVHRRLTDMGIVPVYAVPGQLLERGREVYRPLADAGAEFINHGYAIHARYCPETQHYESFFFYDQLARETVLDDIQRGHQAHLEVLGKPPCGFRVPHFGTFQQPEHLRFLHTTLQQMGYRYSSSTTPLYGFLHGPLPRVGTDNGLYEIPLSGCYDKPLSILDSWSFRYAPGRSVTEADYRRQFVKMVSFFSSCQRPGLLNYYADPSQVYDWPDFFACMELAAPFALSSYQELLQKVAL